MDGGGPLITSNSQRELGWLEDIRTTPKDANTSDITFGALQSTPDLTQGRFNKKDRVL